MRQPVKQIAYKYCVNLAKNEFPHRILGHHLLCTKLRYG